MVATVNKGYELQVTGSNSGTWGAVNNDDVIQIIDNNMGGTLTKGLSNINVTLTPTEAQNCILRLTGALTGAVQITNSCVGFYFVDNATTGNFTVTITNGVGTPLAVPQGTRSTVIADATNGCRFADQSLIPSGTIMLFRQTSAPTGWVKQTSLDNGALRVVSGTAGSGGTADFSSVFTSRAIAQANLPNVSLTGATTTTGTHAHSMLYEIAGNYSAGGAGLSLIYTLGTGPRSALTATDGAHNHNVSVSLGGSGTAMDFAVKYADVIFATKS